MTQSVELLLDDTAEQLVLGEWDRLAAAGLPTERWPAPGPGLPVLAGAGAASAPARDGEARPSPTHRPHVTLWAGAQVAPEVDATLPTLVGELALPVRLGALLVFGPRRGRLVVVRQVVVSAALLALQARLAAACGVEDDSHFAPGRWTPHVTLARRVAVEQLGAVVQALGDVVDVEVVARTCRRWDGDAKVAWTLAPPPVSG